MEEEKGGMVTEAKGTETAPHFTVLSTLESAPARLGLLRTPHGEIRTPAFSPVGTVGSVKGMTPDDLVSLGAEMILCNAYHLYLRPGHAFIAKRKGIHPFIGWDRPILTDSGGYQVFSLNLLSKVNEEGVLFQSHIDGSRHFLTPEKSIEIQEALGADIIMAFDECLSYPSDYAKTAASLDRTLGWARRSKEARRRKDQCLYGIIQGGFYDDLRQKGVEGLLEIGFDGYAVGGLSVGEPQEKMLQILENVVPKIPAPFPRYLMGVGTPEDLVEGVLRGIDLFDCVLPTRHARTGSLFTRRGAIHIKNAQYTEDDRPLDPDCGCYTCRRFSRAYLRHLFMAKELLAIRLNTLHNLYYYLTLMKRLRRAIEEDALESFRKEFYRLRAEPHEG
ncbi:MAG TPA: tRNA guanosine(34) transglycosylase Tgt [Candidatus Manganitrophaceae bacterium]|nr:tRNA guanosine(34) transglycosylase Tgt [Candidatus Manganitrophaceae bacterium]